MPFVKRDKQGFVRLAGYPYQDRWGGAFGYIGSITFAPIGGYAILPIVPVVSTPPVPTLPVADGTVAAPGTTLTSAATGTPPLTRQWKFSSPPYDLANTGTVSGATASTYTTPDYFDSITYRYWCVWTNSSGSTASKYFSVTMST